MYRGSRPLRLDVPELEKGFLNLRFYGLSIRLHREYVIPLVLSECSKDCFMDLNKASGFLSVIHRGDRQDNKEGSLLSDNDLLFPIRSATLARNFLTSLELAIRQ